MQAGCSITPSIVRVIPLRFLARNSPFPRVRDSDVISALSSRRTVVHETDSLMFFKILLGREEISSCARTPTTCGGQLGSHVLVLEGDESIHFICVDSDASIGEKCEFRTLAQRGREECT